MTVAGLKLTGRRTMAVAGLALAIAGAWVALAALHRTNSVMLETLTELCLAVGTSAGFGLYPGVFGMWCLMSVSMMLPTALPAIDLYAQLADRMESGRGVRVFLFVVGYLVAWCGFGAIAAAAQIALASVPADRVPPGLATGALLVLAGGYQLSALKQRCLDLCRNPMLFFMARWRESLGGTLGLGVQHGLICIGCCWALMLLMFVTGVMNLLWMALLAIVMLAEKLLPRAGQWGRAGGVLMISAGAASIASTLL